MHDIFDFPRQSFRFCLAQDVEPWIKEAISQLVDNLATSREWSVKPPKFLDAVNEDGQEVVGGDLEVYSALLPTKLPADMDLRNLEEVEALINEVKVLSLREELAFEFWLGDTYVGSIEDGVVDRTLQEGLINPWRDNLK